MNDSKPVKPKPSAEIPENLYLAGMHSPQCISHWLRESTCICPKPNPSR